VITWVLFTLTDKRRNNAFNELQETLNLGRHRAR
jgi:hypothetical protein